MIKKITALALALAIIFVTASVVFADALNNLENVEEILNSVQLNPTDPQSGDLGAWVYELVQNLTCDKSSTYEKINTCYDYDLNNTRYGSHMARIHNYIGGTTCWSIYQRYGEVEGFGAVALTTGVGMCNAYSAAFILMARKVGLNDIRLVEGNFVNRNGSYNYHKWAEATINGVLYVFDPQVEQNMSAAYNNFCRTYAELPNRYVKWR
jgi:transglutaminase/protease-like cytokinesis protein 3